MKTSELTSYLLDYWVAKAEGFIIRDGLSHNNVQCHIAYDDDKFIGYIGGTHVPQYEPSSNWAHAGPLVEKYALSLQPDCHQDPKDKIAGVWFVQDWHQAQEDTETHGTTPMQAICRAVVHYKFGDEVDDVG